MFEKVLIVDDVDLYDIALVHLLKELHVPHINYAKYCDDAFLKVKRAIHDNDPYQLLITDLSFKRDHKTGKLNSGEELIEAVKGIDSEIKVIVFSIEDKTYRVKRLFEKYNIDGFVIKGRYSVEELKTAINKAFTGSGKYLSKELSCVLQTREICEIDDYDIQLLKYLALGIGQEIIELKFKELKLKPNSKSTIEKRINKLKIYFNANNTVHLVVIAKDMGLV